MFSDKSKQDTPPPMAEAEIYCPPPEAPAAVAPHHRPQQQVLAPAVAVPLPPEAAASTVPEYAGAKQHHHQHQQYLPTIWIQPGGDPPPQQVVQPRPSPPPEQTPPSTVSQQKQPNRFCTPKAIWLAAVFVILCAVAVVLATTVKSDSSISTSGGSNEQYNDPSTETQQEIGDNNETKIVGNPLPFAASIDMKWSTSTSQEFEISLAQLNGFGTVTCTLRDTWGTGNPNISFYTPEYDKKLCSSSATYEAESSFDTEKCSFTTSDDVSVLPNIIVLISAGGASESSLSCYQDETPTIPPTPSPSVPSVVLYQSNPFGMTAYSSSDLIVPKSVSETGTITCRLSVLEGGSDGIGFSVSVFQGGTLCSAGVQLECSFEAERLPSSSIAVHISIGSQDVLLSYSCL